MEAKEDKIIKLLSTLSKYELSRFDKFLNSPYFNENKEMVLFFRAIVLFLEKDHDPIRQEIWQRAFGKRTYTIQKYRRFNSDLTKLAYRFLSIEWHERNGFSGLEGVLKKVNSSNLSKHYMTALRNIRKDLDGNDIRNADYYYYKYVSEYESHVHLERTKAKRSTLSNLQDADSYLDVFYIINKLKHYCDALNYKTILSIEIEVKIMANLIRFIEENDYLDYPAVDIYYTIIKTLVEPKETRNYFHLEKLLEQHYSLFPLAELKTLYIYATNYCISSLNSGNKEFFEHLYSLYFTMLRRKTLFNHVDELDERHYKNIITLGVRLKDYEGVESFILEYSPKLKKEHRENALTYNLAHLYFAKEEYNKVIGQLSRVEYKDIFYALGSKLMLLKTYYELDEFAALDSQIDTFRIYLRRNKLISGKMKTQYMNFLKYLKKMVSIPKFEKENFRKLEEDIERTVEVNNKNWLKEKIALLK